MSKLPENFAAFTENLLAEAETVEGFLSHNEMCFLALLAACPTANGDVLEIGSFKGKSTVILAKAAQLAGDAKIYAVDPLTAPCETDPDLRGDESSLKDFKANIERHKVTDLIEFHQTFSHQLAATWTRPLRLLWIDGDHTYKGTKLDFDGFAPFLNDGAIVAIHDVLHAFDGGVRVFMEDILLSPNFGACGFCGSIGWAQYRESAATGERYRAEKLSLYTKLSRLIPHIVFGGELRGLEKKIYKLKRSRVPRSAVNPSEWLKKVT